MDKVSILALVLLLGVLIGNDVSAKPQTLASYGGLIVGGRETDITEVPYQVYLIVTMAGMGFQCGGSIISVKWILSAAHCLTGVTNVEVRAGSTYSDEGGTVYNTQFYTIHPLYDPSTSDYDFGLIKVLSGITLDGVRTKAVPLPEQGAEVPTGTDLLVSGWGDTTEGGSTSRTLMSVNVQTVSYETCRASYGDAAITERMICAGEAGKDSCQGDSGGPAVDNGSGKQVGVVSFGIGCARPDHPGVYSNVSYVRNWISTIAGV